MPTVRIGLHWFNDCVSAVVFGIRNAGYDVVYLVRVL